MNPDRRHLLSLLPSALTLLAASSIPSPVLARAGQRDRAKAALLLPLTGASAAMGLSMERAAALLQSAGKKDEATFAIDTGGSAEGAGAAARTAAKRGAQILIGPLFAAETRAVMAATGLPVLSFSNDESLAGGGAFLLGVTATQSVSAILGYARRRGVRKVAVLGGTTPWATQGMAAVERLRGSFGLDIATIAPGAPNLLAAMRAAGGDLPDALLVTDNGDALPNAARALQGSGVQLLGSQQTSDALAAQATGAWVPGLDPHALADFADRYRARTGSTPGSIAALAFDGAAIVETLRATGLVDRAAILAASGFAGATGPIRFRADGTAQRELAILVAGQDGYSAVDKSPTA
jgi:ABC-type branched-subunit amino acid transport system substrate-binding protein